MSIQLTEQDEATIRDKVESGLYRNADEVVHAALRLLDELERSEKWLNAELQRGIDGLNRGERVELTPELIDNIKQEARRNAGANLKYREIKWLNDAIDLAQEQFDRGLGVEMTKERFDVIVDRGVARADASQTNGDVKTA